MSCHGIAPMLTVKGAPPVGPGWAFEWKWDGVRIIATVSAGGALTLTSRSGRDMTAAFPELAELGLLVGGALRGTSRVVLDGEVVALDGAGMPDIGLIQRRLFGTGGGPPVVFMVFDVLVFDDHCLLGMTYQQRRGLLETLDLNGAAVRTPPAFPYQQCADVLRRVAELGGEGVIGKRLDSTYRPGRRSRDWVASVLRDRREVVIGGWRTGPQRALGALMMGAYDPAGDLVYLGEVGSGFSDHALTVLGRQLEPLSSPACPFRGPLDEDGAHWVSPVLVGDVEYRTRTRDGLLRYAAWKGLRVDKSAGEVTV